MRFMGEIEKKRGRPSKGGRVRNRVLLFRVTDEEYEEFERFARIEGCSKTDLFMDSFNTYKNVVLAKHPYLSKCVSENDDIYEDYYDYEDNFDSEYDD